MFYCGWCFNTIRVAESSSPCVSHCRLQLLQSIKRKPWWEGVRCIYARRPGRSVSAPVLARRRTLTAGKLNACQRWNERCFFHCIYQTSDESLLLCECWESHHTDIDWLLMFYLWAASLGWEKKKPSQSPVKGGWLRWCSIERLHNSNWEALVAQLSLAWTVQHWIENSRLAF